MGEVDVALREMGDIENMITVMKDELKKTLQLAQSSWFGEGIMKMASIVDLERLSEINKPSEVPNIHFQQFQELKR